jgi:predicted aspartyl protease
LSTLQGDAELNSSDRDDAMGRTIGGNGVGRISIEFQVANNRDVTKAEEKLLAQDKVRRLTIPGVVDSGAARLVLPKSVVKQLGLPVAGKVKVRYANSRTRTRDMVQNVLVEIQGRQGTFTAIVGPKRNDALIGVIILEDLDFLVDCLHQRLVPRDPNFIISEIEASDEISCWPCCASHFQPQPPIAGGQIRATTPCLRRFS